MTDTLIVVPMKDPAASKTRLSGVLKGGPRARLAWLLFRRTLQFLQPLTTQHGAKLAVVTSSEDVAEFCAQEDVTVIFESGGESLNKALEQAAAWAQQRGFARLCVIPADLAVPDAQDVALLLQSAVPVTVCPASDRGTNALLVSPPCAIRFRYGPRSALRHLEEAEANGLQAVLMPLDSLSFDIDTTDCLDRALKIAPDLREGVQA